eukprot:3306632-Prymnesium_polylepis.1
MLLVQAVGIGCSCLYKRLMSSYMLTSARGAKHTYCRMRRPAAAAATTSAAAAAEDEELPDPKERTAGGEGEHGRNAT